MSAVSHCWGAEQRISGSEQGAVYVFERTESGWFQRYELTPPAPHEGSFRFATNVGLREYGGRYGALSE